MRIILTLVELADWDCLWSPLVSVEACGPLPRMLR